MSRLAAARRRPALALGLLALVASAVAGASTAPYAEARTGERRGVSSTARPLLSAVDSTARVSGERAGLSGRHQLVELAADVLPRVADGQRLQLPAASGSTVVRIDSVESEQAFTAWSGRVPGEDLASFTLVEVDGTFRGSLVSPEGLWSLAGAGGGRYWWTQLGHRDGLSGDDSASVGAAAGTRTAEVDPRAAAGAGAGERRARRVRIGVMFGYTAGARAEAGSKEALKAAAVLVVAQTNEALSNSGVRATLRYRGLVKARGKESADAVKDAFRVGRPRDGHFDNLQRVRRKKGGDIVHLLTTGPNTGICGGGLIPLTPRQATPLAGASVTRVGCLPYLVATHEIGHNLGADHFSYPGVTRASRVPYARGFANPADNYISVMGYYDPCVDAGNYSCVRIPWFSSPTNTYGGQPLGENDNTDNTRVIEQTAPRVARYVR